MRNFLRALSAFLAFALASSPLSAYAAFTSPALTQLKLIVPKDQADPVVPQVQGQAEKLILKILGQDIDATGLSDDEISAIKEISEFISQNNIKPVSSQELYYGALHGMFEALHDPYSQFLDPRELKELMDAISSKIGGVGINYDEAHVVLYTVAGSPAARGGIKPGDKLLEVDGQNISSWTMEQISKAIRGDKGTRVTLRFERMANGRPQPFAVTLTRDEIQLPNVFSKLIGRDKGYIYIASYDKTLGQEVLMHARKLIAAGATSLIIDERQNGGGYVDAAVDLSSLFLRQGQTIYSWKNRKGQGQTIRAQTNGPLAGLHLTIIVDGHSASASEIFAGAMQDNGRARIVGSRSFGKGIAQIIVPLKDGSAFKLTTQRWFTPKGHSIQKDPVTHIGGIVPDVAVSLSPAQEEKILEQLFMEINGGRPSKPVADPALQEALRN